ncbi:cytochrome c oxidase assembly protein [Pseudoroseomonas globiformis]|uniref:Cytochrome c oxidase assembly protein n=1 Tax=Teichococcus globiformis TaxID=2307229 RepID=A0ABV7G9S1_9PROT
MRRVALPAGGAVLVLAWGGPFSLLFGTGFTGGMAVHMAVVAIAAPLLAVGLAGGRLDPLARHCWIGPIGASLVEFAVVWGWHLPTPHDAARGGGLPLVLEQASFLLSGLLLWLAALRPGQGPAGIVALLLTSMHMTLLGVLLTLAPRPLYDHAGHAAPHGLSAMEDQALGGVVMLLVGGAAYLAGGLALAARLLGPDPDSAGQPAQGKDAA